jgi:hypothetical protein
LPATRAIVAAAPSLQEWEFHPAKQFRPGWELQFDMRAEDGVFVGIDASRWRFAYDRADRTLAIEAANLDGLSDDDKIRAVEITLDGVIGEELRLIAYDKLVVAEAFVDDDAARPLAALREALFDA